MAPALLRRSALGITLVKASRTPSRLSLRSRNTVARRHNSIRCMSSRHVYVGYDFGTSGARLTAIDEEGNVLADEKNAYSKDAPDYTTDWERALLQLTSRLEEGIRSRVAAVAFDGTSATTILLDQLSGAVLAPAKLYNERQPVESVHAAEAIAPRNHTAVAPTSALCKVLTWHLAGRWQKAAAMGLRPCILHQADWLASLLHGHRDVTDWNNSLKLGYDPQALSYPAWLLQQEYASLLPQRVYAPGAPVARITADAALRTGLPLTCLVCAGTTDSIAAFIAAGVAEPGQAVTSLGSTLAVKLLSRTRVDDAQYGVYSHRLGSGWLVGGASNTGGAALRQLFSDEDLRELTALMDPSKPTGLDYYPLPARGERFPVNDPDMEPRLEPRPETPHVFLQGIFESMSRIEARAYSLLTRLGATPVKEVLTAGGGAVNPVWTEMRAAALQVPVRASIHGDASYGAAILARQGMHQAVASAADAAGGSNVMAVSDAGSKAEQEAEGPLA